MPRCTTLPAWSVPLCAYSICHNTPYAPAEVGVPRHLLEGYQTLLKEFVIEWLYGEEKREGLQGASGRQ